MKPLQICIRHGINREVCNLCTFCVLAIIAIAENVYAGDPEAEKKPSLDDIRLLVKSSIMQIHDLEWSYTVKECSVKDMSSCDNSMCRSRISFDEGWKWEEIKKLHSTFMSKNNVGEEVIRCWNGTASKYIQSVPGGASNNIRRLGGISSSHIPFYNYCPLYWMGIYKGAGRDRKIYTMINDIESPDTKLIDMQIYNGERVALVECNVTPGRAPDQGVVVKYWINLHKGGMPNRMEMYVKNKLFSRGISKSIKEVAPGIYLPTSVEMGAGDDENDVKSEGHEKFTIFIEVDMDSVRINQKTTKKDYDIQFPDDITIHNDDSGQVVQVGKGSGLAPPVIKPSEMDALSEKAITQYKSDRDAGANMIAGNDNVKTTAGGSENIGKWILPLMGMGVLVFGIGLWIKQRKRVNS